MGELHGTNEGAIDFGGDGTLQQLDRDDKPVFASIADKNSFDVCQRPGVQANALANAEERMRATESTGADKSLNGLHLNRVGRGRLVSETNDIFDRGNGEYGEAIAPAHAAEK